MVISRKTLKGEPSRAKKSQQQRPTQEQERALEVVRSIDTGMTLTRFQIASASAFEDAEEDIGQHLKEASALIESVDLNRMTESLNKLGRAFANLARVVDLLDKDLEDVAEGALDDI